MLSKYKLCPCSTSLLFASNNICLYFQKSSDILNKNTLGVKKCEANQKQYCKQVRPKTLISVEAKKLLIKNLFNYLNDIQ